MPTRPHIEKSEHPIAQKRDPVKLMLSMAMAGSCLLFIFLFIFFILRKPEAHTRYTMLPITFWISSVALMLSSITMHEAGIAFKNERFKIFRISLGLTLGLGLTFVGLQIAGWLTLRTDGIMPSDANALRFIYLVTGLHLIHLLAGLLSVGWLFFKALINYSYIDAFVYSVNPPNQHKLQITSVYWHFLDVLWMVIFLFLIYQHPV